MKLLKFLTVPDGSYKLDMFLTCHWHLFSWDIWQAQCHAEDLQDRDGTLKKKKLCKTARKKHPKQWPKSSVQSVLIVVSATKYNKVQHPQRSIDPSIHRKSTRAIVFPQASLAGWPKSSTKRGISPIKTSCRERLQGAPFLRRTSWNNQWERHLCTHCGWKKFCTTLDGWNPMNNGINMDKHG